MYWVVRELICICWLYYINIDKGGNFFAKQFEHTQQNSFERSTCSPLCNQIRIKWNLDNFGTHLPVRIPRKNNFEPAFELPFRSFARWSFSATAAASYLGADVTDLRAISSEMSPLPTSQRCFCATAMDSHRCLFSHKLSGARNKFQPTCRANLNVVNKTKVEFLFAQSVTKQGAATVTNWAGPEINFNRLVAQI